MITFKDLTPENWSEFNGFLLNSELNLPEAIRASYDEYSEILLNYNYIAKIVLLDSKYMGNIIGYCPIAEEIIKYGIENVDNTSKFIYLLNFIIDPPYQGQGYGYLLLSEFIKAAKEKGYERLIGHFRQNSSLSIIKKLGAQERIIYKDWENSGEDFVVCELNLQAPVIQNFLEQALLKRASVSS